MPDKPVLTGRSWLLPVLVVVAAAAVIAVLLWPETNDDGQSPADAAEQVQPGGQEAPVDVVDPGEYDDPEQMDLTDLERRDAEDPLAAGETDAAVTLIVFSDYQCPYCASWSDETLPEMMDYVESGDLRIEWRDLNVFGPASDQAALGAYAAGLQGSFWEYHHQLFDDGDIRSEDQLSEDQLVALAGELDLNVDQFTEDMNSAEVAQHVTANEELGYSIGAYSTPSFILGGEPMVGAQPTEVFTDAVDQALAEAGR